MANSFEKNNIGLDFGTTYSIISRLEDKKYNSKGDLEDYRLEAWIPSEGSGSGFEDSIVVKKKDGKYTSGSVARNETGRVGSKTFKGFKMMLAENDERALSAQGYDENDTPENITKIFLSQLFEKFTSRKLFGEEKIDNLVIGVPEIWFKKLKTTDCRKKLEEMVKKIPCVSNVELISEPAAACAYCVDNYRKKNKKRFNGRILVVDYGGGTLDIALCGVADKGNCSEVSVEYRCGAGENEEGHIGRAGLAFMEEVVKVALRTTGLNDDQIKAHRYFYKYLHDIEIAIMGNGTIIKNNFTYNNTITKRIKSTEEIAAIAIDEENEIIVTCGMLAQAYENVIRPVLTEKLNDVIEYMKKKNITYSNDNDNFKIAIVGGFSNFYLTNENIANCFAANVSSMEEFTDVVKEEDREKAISFGATLVANRLIDFKLLSPIHLGIGSGDESGLNKSWIIIKKNQEITYDKPIFAADEDGDPLIFRGKCIPLLVYSYTDDDDLDGETPLYYGLPHERHQKSMELDPKKLYKIGFSFDSSTIITLHTQAVKSDGSLDGELKSIQLDDLDGIFGNITTVKLVKNNNV